MTSKKFIALVLSLAIVITGVSAPRAQAMDEDALGALLFGVTALAVLGLAVSEKDKHRDKVTQAPAPAHRPVHKPVHKPKPVTKPHKSSQKSWLPRQCSRRFQTHNGHVIQAYGQRCLHRAQYPSHRLPEQCYVRAQGPKGRFAGYRTRCLNRNGYQVSFR